MNAVAVVALRVTLVLMVSRDVQSATPCPRSCITDVQVLSCRRLTTRDLQVVGSCVEDLPLTAVVDLTYNKIACSCEFLKLSKKLLQSKIILFDSTKCSSKVIKGCYTGQYNRAQLVRNSGSYFHVVGAVFNIGSTGWRRRFDRHYIKLRNILTRIVDSGTRHFYLVRLIRIIRNTEWRMDSKALKEERSPDRNDAPKRTNATSIIEINKYVFQNVSREEAEPRMVNFVIFSSIIGATVLGTLVGLICKLDSDRRTMLKTRPMGYVDPQLQTRIWSWHNFLKKLQLYKREKAEEASRVNGNPQVTGRLFVKQSKVEPKGEIQVQENGPAAAVTSLTKMVAQQPFQSFSHTQLDGSSRALLHGSRSSLGSQRFEPKGLSSREPSSDALCGQASRSKQSVGAMEELEIPIIAQSSPSTGGGNSDESIPASVEDNT
ncbi:uncharacterized protein LOC124131061 [Haliotis rufescens]|uniref:uncharacterized protein LOC124131061 n=1 Tax=Haliotis rufescens TaxID=6454 RepID=UPI00201F0ECF|nr:uncharacterized protein LOC124131061 [Haliotis rufescens]XP_046350100.2 uncharacterized protein LOC124131061 [Haliotis rufescens]